MLYLIEGRNNRGNTLLHLAVNNNNYEEVKKLVQEGASINAKNEDGLTPFELANTGNQSNVVRFFVGYRDERGYTLLHYAAMNNNLPVIDLLLKEGAEVNAQNKEGYTPLHEAAFNGHLSVIEKLIEKGANIDAENKEGYTPLHLAVLKGHLSVVEKLIDNNANVNKKNSDGNTPLHLTAYNGRFYVEKSLLREVLIWKLKQEMVKHLWSWHVKITHQKL